MNDRNSTRRRIAVHASARSPLLDRLEGVPFERHLCQGLDEILSLLQEGQPDVLVIEPESAAASSPGGASAFGRLAEAVVQAAPGLPIVVVRRPDDATPPHEYLLAGARLALEADTPAVALASLLEAVCARHAELSEARAAAAAQASWIHTKGKQIQEFRESLRELDHELMTPVAVIQGYCSNLLDGIAGPINDEQRAQLERVRATCGFAADVIGRFKKELPDERDVQDALQHDARTPRRRRVRLPELVREAAEMFAVRAGERGVAIAVDADPRCQPVWGDRVRLLQLLVNLLGNAVRLVPSGGRVDVELAFVDEPGKRKACRLVVRDDGPGIAAEDQWKVFFSGWSSDPERRGMGLAICAEVAAEHGAALELESGPGCGAAFTLELPVDPRARQLAVVSDADADLDGPKHGKDRACPRS